MKSSILVRQAVAHDIEAVAALFDAYRQFYEKPTDMSLAGKFIRERIENSESIILVAELSHGELTGFCQLYPSFCSVIARPVYILYDLYVSPSARRCGTARLLLNHTRTLAEQNGVARIDLSTARTNIPAQKLYESLGWKRDDVFQTYNLIIRENRGPSH